MGGDLYVVGQILAGDVATHPLSPWKRGCGKIVTSLVTDRWASEPSNAEVSTVKF
jgi:hypothetical protein